MMCTLKRVPNITKIPTGRACFERCALAKVLIAYYGLVHFKTSAYHRQGFDDNIWVLFAPNGMPTVLKVTMVQHFGPSVLQKWCLP